jgi:hypothetical protein
MEIRVASCGELITCYCGRGEKIPEHLLWMG